MGRDPVSVRHLQTHGVITTRGCRDALEKKPMEPLIFVVSRREQLVSRRDIDTKLWRSNLFIDTEPNINNIVRKIRTALGDNSTKTALPGDRGRKRVPIYRPVSGD